MVTMMMMMKQDAAVVHQEDYCSSDLIGFFFLLVCCCLHVLYPLLQADVPLFVVEREYPPLDLHALVLVYNPHRIKLGGAGATLVTVL